MGSISILVESLNESLRVSLKFEFQHLGVRSDVYYEFSTNTLSQSARVNILYVLHWYARYQSCDFIKYMRTHLLHCNVLMSFNCMFISNTTVPAIIYCCSYSGKKYHLYLVYIVYMHILHLYQMIGLYSSKNIVHLVILET